jgi:membrane protein YqaA with SNARE-associated domain
MMRVLRAILGLVAAIVALVIVATYAREPVERFARALVELGGLGGLGLATFLGDPVPGVGFVPAAMLGYAGGVDPVVLFAVISAASFASSLATWGLGRVLRQAPWIPAFLDRWRIGPMLRRRGAMAVAVAAVSPVPWGVAALGAGASDVAFGPFALGAAARPLKIAVTIAALVLGWSAAA